jgi:hypothetical protein
MGTRSAQAHQMSSLAQAREAATARLNHQGFTAGVILVCRLMNL